MELIRKWTPSKKKIAIAIDRELTAKDSSAQRQRNSSRCQAISNANTKYKTGEYVLFSQST